MPTALVVRTQRHKKIGDSSSPMVYTLKRKPQDAKIFDLARIAQDIEALGAMSAEENDSNATTKGGANNLVFELVTADKDSTGGGSGGNNPDGGGSDGDQGENPLG